MSLSGNWNYPNSIVSGAGTVEQLGDYCLELEIRSPLIVSDKGVSQLPFFDQIIDKLNNNGLTPVVFDDVDPNPSKDNVDEGVGVYKGKGCDGIVTIGGGSAIDAGKAIALMVGQNRDLWDFEDVGDNWKRVDIANISKVIAVPTTAGTGSEVGRASVITDSINKQKKIVFHPKMLPEVVILDPQLTTGLPSFLTAATGLDALSHCLEALCSPSYHPMGEGIAIEGIRLIYENLSHACEDGNDLEARMNMLVASSMGATAFQKGLGAMHAIAHSIGALYGTHHGLLNAILMPFVLEANREKIESKITRLARYLGLSEPGFDSFLNWVLLIRKQLKVPHTLSQVIEDQPDLSLLASMSVKDPSAGGNPIDFSEQEYRQLISRAYFGE